MPPTPARGRSFRLRDRSIDLRSGEASFVYDLDGVELEERLVLPVGSVVPSDDAVALLLDVCHVAIGTSYFKVSAPTALRFDRPVAPEIVALTHQTYDEGLREFAFVNGLPLPLDVEISAETAPGPRLGAGEAAGCRRPLLPIGGGKDSAAVLTLVPGGTGITVSPTGAQRRLATTAGIELLEVRRTLDPALAELTVSGFNGHIPITAINSAISVLVAALHGHDCVVLGNERSASEPTRTVDGVAVNHQHSKSFAYEEAFTQAVAGSGIAYFSLLRQLSELSIAGIVSANEALRGSFLSCNRAFTRSRDPDDVQTWCLECAKCLFTFLSFAPFLSPDEAVTVFGGNPLADASLAAAFRDLWQIDTKPFDCVGERVESAVAMAWLATADGWRSLPVVEALAGDAGATATDLDATMDLVLRPAGPHRIPAELADAVAVRADKVRPRR